MWSHLSWSVGEGHYVVCLGPKDRPIAHLPVSSSIVFAVVEWGLTFAVLFKSFTFKFSVKARNSLCTKEYFTAKVLGLVLYFIGRYVWLHMLLTVMVTVSALNLVWTFRWDSQELSPFVEKYFCKFPLKWDTAWKLALDICKAYGPRSSVHLHRNTPPVVL